MLKINFYQLGKIDNDKLLYAVIVARYNGQWIFVKHKERDTWEIPGGHREISENINDTAARELFEETGAKKFILTPICIYSVEKGNIESHGQLFYAEVQSLDNLPDYEIEQIRFFKEMPKNLTYPLIQPHLFQKVLSVLKEYKENRK
ncbi:NUDIX hydrolase [Haloimpatiens massiliensis]|uniref:NUDIX hydrolase n=1 Tax=Haloimpatiens massiliensis TaxID=1658110 RepID=UPI000C863EFC|nr:NUDIX domain-containing protein [Haloimpatiens massiliensis]